MANIKDVAKLAGVLGDNRFESIKLIKDIYHRIHMKVYIEQLINWTMFRIRLHEIFLNRSLIISA